MSNRGLLLLVLVPALFSNARYLSGQNVAVQVQVYDYADLSPAALAQFIARTQEILLRSGVAVEVDACPRGTSSPCESRSGSLRQLIIRLVPKAPANKTNLRWQHLGQSMAGHDGGVYASIFLELAQEEANEANLPPVIVLAYAAAHEVGHLLLGDQAHTARGLMRARWDTDDFQAMAQNRFSFVPAQIRELRERYGTPPLNKASATSDLAGRR
jgi:hypothetical protein